MDRVPVAAVFIHGAACLPTERPRKRAFDRFSDRVSFSARFRAGSNFPVVGYYESRHTPPAGGSPQPGPPFYFISTTRNNVRVPVYSRLDVRANRTFSVRAARLTLFAEVLNLYARDNVRAASAGIDGATFQVFD